MSEKEIVITKDMVLGDVIRLKPRTLGTLMGFGLACIGCPASQMETIEEAAMIHGIEPDFLLNALNER